MTAVGWTRMTNLRPGVGEIAALTGLQEVRNAEAERELAKPEPNRGILSGISLDAPAGSLDDLTVDDFAPIFAWPFGR